MTQWTRFALSMRDLLVDYNLTQKSLAERLGVSPMFVSLMVHGKRCPSPKWVERIADTMVVSPSKRVEMHRAAARDKGFKIDLWDLLDD